MFRKMFFPVVTVLSVCTLIIFDTGCSNGRAAGSGDVLPEPEPPTWRLGDVPVTPLHLGPYLLPFGSEPATTYGIATGLWTENSDSIGLFIPFGGDLFEGENYGVAFSPVCSFAGNSDFYGISAGILNLPDDLIPGRRFAGRGATQNGISIFPFEWASRTNGLSIEGINFEKEFNGIDICLFCAYEGENNGLQVVGWDGNASGDGTLNGCQIGWYLRSSVRGAQIGAITYNPCVSDETCLDVGVVNCDLKHGIQIGGFNRTGDGNPLQIGLFNFAWDGSPFQIGLLNYNPNGFLPFFPIINFSTK